MEETVPDGPDRRARALPLSRRRPESAVESPSLEKRTLGITHTRNSFFTVQRRHSTTVLGMRRTELRDSMAYKDESPTTLTRHVDCHTN